MNNSLMCNVPSAAVERFDANTAAAAGTIYKIWSRNDGNIYARLQLIERNPSENAGEGRSPRLTLAFPEGKVNGSPFSLSGGDRIETCGYLADVPYRESLSEFLERANRASLLEEYPLLGKFAHASLQRVMTCLIPLRCAPLPAALEQNEHAGVCVEGIVSRVWNYGKHFFARIASYDPYCEMMPGTGNGGRVRRKPHYVTVQFTHGAVGKRAIQSTRGGGDGIVLEKKTRIRASGRMIYRIYYEDLRSFLLNAGAAEGLADLPNADTLGDIRASHTQSVVEAQQLVVYT